jgi:tRNA(Ile)-lysidine synthetase-like protein
MALGMGMGAVDTERDASGAEPPPKRPSDEILGRFGAAMSALDPDWAKKSFVVGFSGGPDSLALALLLSFSAPREKILALHLDHSISAGSGAAAAAAAVLAQRLGISFFAKKVDAPRLAGERGRGLEEAGRFARYQAFGEERVRRGADYVLTAHQAGDLTETALLRLVRGLGPGGLSALSARSGRVLRPLLGFSREELLQVALGSGLAPLEDPTNLDLRRPRNFLRLKVIPLLKELNPALDKAFQRAALIGKAEEDLWAEELDRLCGEVSQPEGGGFSLDAESFGRLHLARRRRVMGRLLRLVPGCGKGGGEPLGFAAVEAALRFVEGGAGRGEDLPSGRRIERRRGRFFLGPASRSRQDGGG